MGKIPTATTSYMDVSDLKLFEPYRKNVTMTDVGEYLIHPSNQYIPTSDRFVFDFPSFGDNMIDMESIQLYIYGAFQRLDGTPVVKEDSMVPTNNLLHSLINEVEMIIGNNRHIIREDSYFYKSYIKNIFEISSNSPRREFELMDVDISTLDKVDNQYNINTEYVGSNRAEMVKDRRKIEMGGPVCVSCLKGYMFSKVPLKLIVSFADPKFTVWTDGSREYQFRVDDIHNEGKNSLSIKRTYRWDRKKVNERAWGI